MDYDELPYMEQFENMLGIGKENEWTNEHQRAAMHSCFMLGVKFVVDVFRSSEDDVMRVAILRALDRNLAMYEAIAEKELRNPTNN